jgi:hypothetical protein
MLILRLAMPILAYFFFVSPIPSSSYTREEEAYWQSLWFTCIEAIWQVPMQNYLGRGTSHTFRDLCKS